MDTFTQTRAELNQVRAEGEEDQIAARQRERITQVFANNRAEFVSDEETFALFATPTYWHSLVGTRPCFLVGGRGTGKTTALRGLSFKGQYKFHGADISSWSTIGSYLRMETNVVSAFQGKRRDDQEWTTLFGHYLNLRLCAQVLDFLDWRFAELGQSTELDVNHLDLFRLSLGLAVDATSETRGQRSEGSTVPEIDELKRGLRESAAKLELGLNNPRRLDDLDISVVGVPVGHLTRALMSDPVLRGHNFLFALDEFENLRPYQQSVVNTLIKHVGDAPYTLKIGVRDAESWQRETLAPGQYLTAPADFEMIDIVRSFSVKEYTSFATNICERRLRSSDSGQVLRLTDLLPRLTTLEEAELLGIDGFLRRTEEALVRSGVDEASLQYWRDLPKLEAAMVSYWAESKGASTVEALQEARINPRKWRVRTGNYSYALLFTLRRRVRGIRKYYAGWPVFLALSAGNIRYALQLVHEALNLHFRAGGSLENAVSVANQTEAASAVGHRVLRELQGSSAEGGSLTRLTLGLGRLFGVMASEPHGHAPEVNQFRVDRRSAVHDGSGVDSLLREAVAQGCLLGFAGNKRASISGETADYDYQLHPIFAAYFIVGHRSKRRMTLRASDLSALASDRTGTAVRSLLAADKPRASAEMPSQLALYGDVFNED